MGSDVGPAAHTDADPAATGEQGNPFARPGSDSSTAPAPPPLVPAPGPVMPVRDLDGAESFASGRRMGAVADGPTPAPRRSAVSSATPPERDNEAQTTSGEQSPSWVMHHRRTLILWVVGALVAALLIVTGFYFAGRRSAEPTTSPIPPTSASPSTSTSPVPEVTSEDLLTVKDADKIVDGASWVVVDTAETKAAATRRAACLGADLPDVNPTETFQRALGTTQDDQLAAMHQMDVYANAGAARQVQTQRTAALAKCSDVPAFIVSASTITGLGDDVTQVTVSFQNDPAEFHTVLLVRTGRALTMLDVARNGKAVDVEGVATSLLRSLKDVCSRVDGRCPANPVVAAAVPPPTEPRGWLIASDLERLRAGYGRWTVTEPADVTSPGMGCENLPLATEPGPTNRAQRTYLLTQDDSTPDTFGMDEMVFDFEDNAKTRAFTTKLINNLLSCKDRVLTAKVTDGGAVNGVGVDGVAVSARMITIDQAISDNSSVRYQLVVSIADNRASYLLASVTNDYQFSADQAKLLAMRSAQRLSQS
ncbi:hypothetical protein [Tessaracoccus antarcticus]|uniref:PknH-like extracellular domain-containing protein n=1 Tax=Tessaracoccus antarcticus TaxID=2479848 RepID=A0A3M0G0A7_9ACTN|nr:hypothetical protein [Tessaracoccus antarcticus]RMB58390.1 hypothetical protein EAX62_14455 [Tessaracoccus antarcticus]